MPPEDDPRDDISEAEYLEGLAAAQAAGPKFYDPVNQWVCDVCGATIPAGHVNEHLIPGPQFQPPRTFWIDTSP